MEVSEMRKAYVVGIVGSPRRGMNTDTLVQQVLDGCMSEGASVGKIYLISRAGTW
jgi:multimeric flavodoxin WrbA